MIEESPVRGFRPAMTPMTSSHHPFHRVGLVAAMHACMFVFGMILLLMGSLLPSLKVSGAQAGSLGSMPLLGILAATIVIGPVLDKRGAKPALAVGLTLIAAGMAVIPSLARYAPLALAAWVYGFGGGIINTATNALVSELSGAGRGAALNLLGFSFSLGAIASPLVTSWAAERWPGASILRALAIAPALVLVFVLVLRFPEPVASSTPLRRLLRVLGHPVVWLIGAILFFESGNENCMFVWAGKLVREALQVPVSRAELALAALSIVLGGGRLLAVLWLKWLGTRSALLLSAATTMAGAAIVLAHHTFAAMVAGFAVVGLGMSAIFPTALAQAGDRFPEESGTVFGAVIALALVGGAAGPVVGGWAASSGAATVLVVPLAGAAAIAILAPVLLSRKQPLERSKN